MFPKVPSLERRPGAYEACELFAATAIFVATYVLISAGRVDPLTLNRPAAVTLGASAILAGNTTILGAAANVIVVQAASRQGVDVTMRDWVRAGIPVTVVTLLIATVVLATFP